jgi:hypothetical protein
LERADRDDLRPAQSPIALPPVLKKWVQAEADCRESFQWERCPVTLFDDLALRTALLHEILNEIKRPR